MQDPKRLLDAIRRFTVDMGAARPNGTVQKQALLLVGLVDMNSAAGEAMIKLAEAMAADTNELRRAAEEYFSGVDLKNPPN